MFNLMLFLLTLLRMSKTLLHNVSSLVRSNESSACEIPVVTYCLHIFVLANRSKA